MIEKITFWNVAWLMFLFIALHLTLPASAAADQAKDEHVFIVKDYSYRPGSKSDNPDIGQSICGTRCNAISVDYLNYTMPGGWRMLLVTGNRELTIDLNNPFMGGTCVCVADEYRIITNEIYMTK